MSQIKITLHSDLCAGSGQGLGNRVDTDICTDSYGIPYVPGRRIKGCLREAAKELQELGLPSVTKESLDELFGGRYGNEGKLRIGDATLPSISEIHGYIEQTRRSGSDLEKKAVHPNSISQMYSYRRGQTSLKDGVKVDGTLRFTNVLKHYDPLDNNLEKELEFFAEVEGDESGRFGELINACCKAVRHMGMNRNRGLGNVSLEYTSNNRSNECDFDHDDLDPDKTYILEYRITNDSALTLPDCDGMRTSIPSKSVIGILAGRYLSAHEKDDTFNGLFLDGRTIWSDITPVINGLRSYPVPMFVAKLKNYGGKIINRFADNGDLDWKALKPKTVETGYMSEDGENMFIADIPLRSIYHNSIRNRELTGEGLYMQDSIDAGYIFSGTVKAMGTYIKIIADLLGLGNLSFGRSRSAQYATCHLTSMSVKEQSEKLCVETEMGEPVFVCLKSDMLLDSRGGCPAMSFDDIRIAVSEELDLSNEMPVHHIDLLSFKTTGGYQGMWHLQKPHVQVISAGSVLCFMAKKDSYPKEIQIGRNKQEGYGVCSVVSYKELRDMNQIQKGFVDRATDNSVKNAAYQKAFRSAAVANACMEIVADNAESVSKQIARLKGEKAEGNKRRKGIPTGKMRLIAFEASDYIDLRLKVDQIKESDIDSASIGRRWECHELLDRLYGTDRQKISCKAMLGFDQIDGPALPDIDEDVQSMLKASWKKPLDIVLHSLNYSGGRK